MRRHEGAECRYEQPDQEGIETMQIEQKTITTMSLRAARSRGHRNVLSEGGHLVSGRYEQPDQEGIETALRGVRASSVRRRYEQPDQEGIETVVCDGRHLIVRERSLRAARSRGHRNMIVRSARSSSASLRAARSRGHRNDTPSPTARMAIRVATSSPIKRA